MKSVSNTYRLMALMMACLMFVTSTGFAMDMHYCGGVLKSVSLFGKAKTCHDMAAKQTASMKNCPRHKQMMAMQEECAEEKNCCSSKTVHIQADQDQQVQHFDFTISKPLQQFVMAYIAVFFTTDIGVEREIPAFAHYKPPLISRDIPVLVQSFLL